MAVRRSFDFSNLNRRSLIAALGGATFLSGCAINKIIPKKVVDPILDASNQVLGTGNKDPFLEYFNMAMSAPLAVYKNVTIKCFDGKNIDVRVAAPAIAENERLPIIAAVTDTDITANYDLVSGSVAQAGYLVLTISMPEIGRVGSQEIVNARRAQYLRFMLDKIPDILNEYGISKNKVAADKIGVAGYGDGAWTALELIGWGRGLKPSSSLADGRVLGSFALMPTPAPRAPETADTKGIIYGRGMIAGNIDSLPIPPKNSGLLGLGLPKSSKGFGGLLGHTRGKKEKAEREILAASCASACLFFDWALKNEGDKLEALAKLEGREIPNIHQPMKLVRA